MNSLPSYGKLLRSSASFADLIFQKQTSRSGGGSSFDEDEDIESQSQVIGHEGRSKQGHRKQLQKGEWEKERERERNSLTTAPTTAATTTNCKGRSASTTYTGVAKSFLSACLYGCVAIAMNFVNKGTLMQFPHSNTILLLQMLSGVVVIQTLRGLGLVQCRPLSLSKAQSLLPITLLYNMNTAAALMGLERVNIPVYSTVKRLTPMLVLGAKVAMTREFPESSILTAVVLVVVGCVVAGAGDLSFDLAGYAFAFMSCSFQATYLLIVEQTGSEKGVGSAELLLYNSLLSLPFLLLVVALTGEVYHIKESFLLTTSENGWFPLLLMTCSSMGCLLNYSMFLCTMNNSALTTTIVGVLKGVLSTFLGFFLLGGVKFNMLNIVGICMNTAGGVLYTVSKHRARNKNGRGKTLGFRSHASTGKWKGRQNKTKADFSYQALKGDHHYKEEKEEQ